MGQDHVLFSNLGILRCSDGFFGEDNSGKSRFDLLLDSATDAVQWIHDQTARLEEGDA